MLIGNNHQIGWPKKNAGHWAQRPSANVSSVWAVKIFVFYVFTVTNDVISPESCDFPWGEAISYLSLNLEHWLYCPILQWLSAKSLRNVCIPAYLPLKVSSCLHSPYLSKDQQPSFSCVPQDPQYWFWNGSASLLLHPMPSFRLWLMVPQGWQDIWA